MSGYSRDRLPHSIEAPQPLFIQYSHDIEFDYAVRIWPTGEEPEFDWEDHYCPIEHYWLGRKVGKHTWRREKQGAEGRWGIPMYIVGTAGKDGIDGVGIAGVRIVNGDLLVYLTNGDIINAGKIPEPCPKCWTAEEILELIKQAIESGEIEIKSCEQCWTSQDILQLINDAITNGDINVGGDCLWESVDGVTSLKESQIVRLTDMLQTNQTDNIVSNKVITLGHSGNYLSVSDTVNDITGISRLDSDAFEISAGTHYFITVKKGQKINNAVSQLSNNSIPIITHTAADWIALNDITLEIVYDKLTDNFRIIGDNIEIPDKSDEIISGSILCTAGESKTEGSNNIYVVYDGSSLNSTTVKKVSSIINTWYAQYKTANPNWVGSLNERTVGADYDELYWERWITWAKYPYADRLKTNFTGNVILICVVDEAGNSPITATGAVHTGYKRQYHECHVPADFTIRQVNYACNQPTPEFIADRNLFIKTHYPAFKSFSGLVYAIPSNDDMFSNKTDIATVLGKGASLNFQLHLVAAIEGTLMQNPPSFSITKEPMNLLKTNNPYSSLGVGLKEYNWRYIVDFDSSINGLTQDKFSSDMGNFMKSFSTPSSMTIKLFKESGQEIVITGDTSACTLSSSSSSDEPTVATDLKSASEVFTITNAMLQSPIISFTLLNPVAKDSFLLLSHEDLLLQPDDRINGEHRHYSYTFGSNVVKLDTSMLYFDLEVGEQITIQYFYNSSMSISIKDLMCNINSVEVSGSDVKVNYKVSNSVTIANTAKVILSLINVDTGIVVKTLESNVSISGNSETSNSSTFMNIPAGLYIIGVSGDVTAQSESFIVDEPVAILQYSAVTMTTSGTNKTFNITVTNSGTIASDVSLIFKFSNTITDSTVGPYSVGAGANRIYSKTVSGFSTGVCSVYKADGISLIGTLSIEL